MNIVKSFIQLKRHVYFLRNTNVGVCDQQEKNDGPRIVLWAAVLWSVLMSVEENRVYTDLSAKMKSIPQIPSINIHAHTHALSIIQIFSTPAEST